MCSALRFCLSVYLDLSPCGMTQPPREMPLRFANGMPPYLVCLALRLHSPGQEDSAMSTSTKPLWNEASPAATGGLHLRADVSCEVCVVGGGIAGLTTAYCLARDGRRVVVLEGQHEVGQGE